MIVREIEENNIDLLMQSKQLVHTSYEVTAIQNRIFYYCLLTAQKEKNGELSCEVKLEDIKKLIPNKNQRTLANIKKTIQILKGTSLEFEKNEDGDTIECDYNLISGSEYNINKEVFKIKFASRLYRHLIDYTVYAPLNLDIVTRFKSFYSQRLYELLRLWSRTDQCIVKNFKIDQLRFILGVENKYPNYKNFKQRVLNQAVKEINEVGNMKVEVEEIKNSRKVEEIKFTIYDFEKKVYFKNTNQNVDIVRSSMIEEVKSDTTISENKDFYIPNKMLFTPKTLKDFKNDFREYDFMDASIKEKFYLAVGITLDKTGSEKIKANSYEYFKSTLVNKIEQSKAKINRSSEVKPIKTRFHNINETFKKYDPQELEVICKDSQKDKFGTDALMSLYNSVIENNNFNELSLISKTNLLNYAREKSLSIPEVWAI